jgi:hypothetical protein
MVKGLQSVVDYLAIQDPLPEQADLLMVLGSQDLKVPLMAAKLYKEGRAKKILVSGGAPAHLIDQTPVDQREANRFKELLIKEGVRQEDIFVEFNSTNTIQNIELSKKLIEEIGIEHDSVILMQFPIGQRIAAELFKKHFGSYPLSYAPYVPDISQFGQTELLGITRGALMFLGRLEAHGPNGLGFIDAVEVPQQVIEMREKARALFLLLESNHIASEAGKDQDEALAQAMIELKFAERSEFNMELITEERIREAKEFIAQGNDFEIQVNDGQLEIKKTETLSEDRAMLVEVAIFATVVIGIIGVAKWVQKTAREGARLSLMNNTVADHLSNYLHASPELRAAFMARLIYFLDRQNPTAEEKEQIKKILIVIGA